MTDAVTAVSFHTGVQEPVVHAVKLVRKALAQDLRVCVTGPSPWIGTLDEALWTMDPGSFLAHARLDAQTPPEVIRRSPVVLVDESAQSITQPLQGRDVLIRLSGAAVGEATSVQGKIIEIVGASPDQRLQGQARWRWYRERGIVPSHHDVSAPA